MALSKRSSRSITVDGTVYRWAFSMDSGYAVIVVQIGEGQGRRLEAQTTVWYPGDQRSVTPRSIAALIRFAISQGWDPAARGAPLRLVNVDEAVDFVPLEDDGLAAGP